MASHDLARVAVIDVGTARTKVLVATKGAPDLDYSSFAIEASPAKELESRGAEAAAKTVAAVLEEALSRVRELGAQRYCAVGAHIFREGASGKLLIAEAKKHVAAFSILSPQQEARVFYSALNLERPPSDFVAADVGGGSVQLVWGPDEGQSDSAPVGTFSLEKRFQRSLEVAIHPDDQAWADASREVTAAFTGKLPRSLRPSTIIVGSNIMETFFRRTLCATGIHTAPRSSFDRSELVALAQMIGGKPYSDSYKLFPENSNFLHGADKLLIVVIALMDVQG